MSNTPSRRRFLKQTAGGAMTVASSVVLTACGGGDDSNDSKNVSFRHGVASGDPQADRVILWTRVTTDAAEDIELDWEVASDAGFTGIVAKGRVSAALARDYTAKVDAAGLTANRSYWYRFRYQETVSPVGRTRTLPTGAVSQVRMAVFSCSNFPAGYFHVYAEAAKRDDIDVALHLGDYIYEYERGGYASDRAEAMGRVSEPANEIVTLADYRRRYAQYRSDPDLQALHARVPFIAIWDDHEIANDTWMDGAENHQPDTEGDFALRKAAAVRAYHEWLPTREPQPLNHFYRSFAFGDLLALHMLDTRVVGRDQQLEYSDYFGALLGNPDPLAGLQDFLRSFAADAGHPQRQLLGSAQQAWLSQAMQASSATWQVLGQQVLMGPVHLPLPVLLGLLSAAGQLGDIELPPMLRVAPDAYVALLRRQALAPDSLTQEEQTILSLPAIPYNLDSWDGYWAARETVLATARALDKNLVVLAGDTHNAWASNLRDLAGHAVGVELATSAVSSPGLETYLGSGYDPALLSQLVTGISNLNTLPAGQNWAGSLAFADTSKRGYMLVTVTPEAVQADWYFVNTVHEPTYTIALEKTLRTLPGADGRTLLPA